MAVELSAADLSLRALVGHPGERLDVDAVLVSLPLGLRQLVGLVRDHHEQHIGADVSARLRDGVDQLLVDLGMRGRRVAAAAEDEIVVGIFRRRTPFRPGSARPRRSSISSLGCGFIRQSSIWKCLPLKSETPFAQSSFITWTYSVE